MAEPNSLDELEVELNQASNKLPWYRTKAFKISSIILGVVAIVLIVLFNKQIGELLNSLMLKAARQFKTITLNNFIVPLDSGLVYEGGKLKLNPPSQSLPKRHIMIIDDPDDYNGNDILNIANQGVDIINWTTYYGGNMTPYRTNATNPDGTYYLDQTQKDLINNLYTQAGQRIFWMGISLWHIDDLFPTQGWNPYAEVASAAKAFTDYFADQGWNNVRVGIYTGVSDTGTTTRYGLYQDESIFWLHTPPPGWVNDHPGQTWDWHDQYAGAENARKNVQDAMATATWSKVLWLITGGDYSYRYNEDSSDLSCGSGNFTGEKINDPNGTLCFYQLTIDQNSYWAHHTHPPDNRGNGEYEIDINVPKNLVYDGLRMVDSIWQNKWWNPPACSNGCKSLTPTDSTPSLVTGAKGSRVFTAIGKTVFGIQ